MEGKSCGSVGTRIEERRLGVARSVAIQQKTIDSTVVSFRNHLQSTKDEARKTMENQDKLEALTSSLRKVERELVKTLAVKTRQEARRMVNADLLSSTKSRVQQLQSILENQRRKKEDCNTFLSHQSLALKVLEEKNRGHEEWVKDVKEAIEWYGRALGMRVETGHGVRFVFTNLNVENPVKEYSFTVRLHNDTYALLDCDPVLDDVEELVRDLNKTNSLFAFVRLMRMKFKAFAAAAQERSVTFSSASAPFSVSYTEGEIGC